MNYWQAAGIRVQLRPLERAAFFAKDREKSLGDVIQSASGAGGNVATRIEAFVAKGGGYVFGTYPDLDDLFHQPVREQDRKKREALLHRLQQLVHEKAMVVPIRELGFLNGVGPRVQASGLGLITGHAGSAPYVDVTIHHH